MSLVLIKCEICPTLSPSEYTVAREDVMQQLEEASKGKVLMVLLTKGASLKIEHMVKIMTRASEVLRYIKFVHLETNKTGVDHRFELWVNGAHIASTKRDWCNATDILLWLETSLSTTTESLVEDVGQSFLGEEPTAILVTENSDDSDRARREFCSVADDLQYREVRFVIVDANICPETAREVSSQAMPCIVLWKNGYVAGYEGVVSREDLKIWTTSALTRGY